jgi:hypothetical protein
MGRPFCLLVMEVIVILNLHENDGRKHRKFQKNDIKSQGKRNDVIERFEIHCSL